MKQEEKDLLLTDLCARLPYNVKVKIPSIESPLTILSINTNGVTWVKRDTGYPFEIDWENCKPYLFPLSSMTEEQKEFIKNRFCYDWDIDDHPYSLWTYCIEIGDADELIDWFHKKHLDYRGLIPKGLAIDATGLNIY
jgi:hypothetical protein